MFLKGIAICSSVCGSLGCRWFTALCHVSLESLLKRGDVIKTFIINQRNHLQGMPFLYLKFSDWSSLQPRPAVLYTRVCFVTWYSGPTGFLSSSRPPLSVSPPLYHSNRQRWEGSKSGNDHIFLSCGWKQNSGGAASQDRSSPERRGGKNWEFERKWFTG